MEKTEYLKNLVQKILLIEKNLKKSKLLEKGTWDGVVDTVGGPALLLKFLHKQNLVNIAACGNAGGIKINTTVMPFIIRGVNFGGSTPLAHLLKRRELQNEAAKLIDFSKVQTFIKELSLDELLETYSKLLKGEFSGRAIINTNK